MKSRKRVISATYMNNIASSIGRNNNNYVFVKHYGRYSIDAEDAKNAMTVYDNIEVNYVHFANNEMVESYEPFLTIIRNCYEKHYSDLTIEEYLDKFDIYQLHKSFLEAYIDSGDCVRYEPFILDEIKFEKSKMLESICNIIIGLSKKHPLLIMIDNVHMVSGSAIRMLRRIFESSDNENIGVFAAYNDLKHISSVNKKEWNSFINIINAKGCVFEGGAYESEAEVEDGNEFVFDSKKSYEYLHKLKAMFCTVELEQAEYYLQKIHKKLANDKVYLDPDCKFELLRLYTDVLINLGDFATALILCDNLKEMYENFESLEYEYNYYLLYTYIQMYSGKIEYAKKVAKRCKEIAKELQNESYIFRADILEYMIDMSGCHNIYFIVKDIELPDEFVEKIKKYKYFNHLANMYIYGYQNDFEVYRHAKTVEDIEQRMDKCGEGIVLAEKLGNTCLILKAYQKLIMITSSVGIFNITEKYYEKYIELAGDSDDKEIAEAKNGQGYVNCTARNFKKSNECYNRALGIFMRRGDIKSVGETLYNMSINCILAQDYNSAFNYLKMCVRIVDKMRLNDLRVCNIAKLYGLLALTSVRLAYEYESSFYLNTNKKFLDHIINNRTYRDADNKDRAFTGNDDELFLHYFVKGLLEERNGEYEQALEYYQKAQKHCIASDGNRFFSFVQLHVAMAKAYRKLDDKENEQLMLDEAYKYAEDRGYTDQMELLLNMKHGADYNQKPVKCSLENYTIEQIDELLDKSSMVMQNQDMSNQIELISVWQNILEIHDKTKEELIRTAANSFMLNFNLDTFLYIKFYDKSAEVVFSDGSVELSENELEMFRSYFEKSKSGFVTAKIDKNYEDYKKILDVFGMDVLNSIVCSPFFENEKLDSLFISCIYTKTNWNVETYRYLLNENEANLFNLLLRQLIIAVEKIENLNEIRHINVALKEASFTDYLTGLRNRNGLNDSFNKILEDAKDKGKAVDLAVLYIDLDNFKYYNDTFGHDVGDLVLKEVASILNSTAKESGFAIRYGGDEFLIVLVNATKEEAMATARLTLDVLLSKNGYVNEISSFLGKQIVIKREKKLSCSIGVATATNVTTEKDLSEILKYADSSLYDVKNTTKNAIKYYDKEEKVEI